METLRQARSHNATPSRTRVDPEGEGGGDFARAATLRLVGAD